MEIRKAETKDLRNLRKLFKNFFTVHAIFTKEDKEILKYLKRLNGEYIVAVDNGKIVGGMAIEYKEYGHKLALFKHIASKKADKEIIKELIKKAEEICGAKKIEIHIAEGEKIPYDFFESLGYGVEGKLKSHYRPNETCYILGKVI